MDSTNFIRHNDSNWLFRQNKDLANDDQLQVKETEGEDQSVHNLRAKDNMAPVQDDRYFNFQESWESGKSLLGSMQECTSMVVRQEEIQEFELSECIQYLQSLPSDNFSAFSPLDDRAVESDDRK